MDKISPQRRSWNMSRIRSADTDLEIRVRKYLFSRGYRYRLNYKLPGRPDIVFPKLRIAVFVNGCFWHMHGCKFSTIPSTRKEFWENKLSSNRKRDGENNIKLLSLGWKVVSIWECEAEKSVENALSPLIASLSETKGAHDNN